MSTPETPNGAGGTGAARIRPAQEAVTPPSPAASPSLERGVAQPTASPEAQTAWPSVALPSPAGTRPPADSPVRVRVLDSFLPYPSAASPQVEASPAARVDQSGPSRAAPRVRVTAADADVSAVETKTRVAARDGPD